jgi:hypothetical protein
MVLFFFFRCALQWTCKPLERHARRDIVDTTHHASCSLCTLGATGSDFLACRKWVHIGIVSECTSLLIIGKTQERCGILKAEDLPIGSLSAGCMYGQGMKEEGIAGDGVGLDAGGGEGWKGRRRGWSMEGGG